MIAGSFVHVAQDLRPADLDAVHAGRDRSRNVAEAGACGEIRQLAGLVCPVVQLNGDRFR